jgi:hypothetical protein
VNPKTGRTDRHALTQAELFEFRSKQVEERHAAKVKRGKRRRASNSPDGAGDPSASAPIPSPLEPLTTPVDGALTPKDSGSSAAATETRADDPASFPEPPSLCELLAPAPSRAPKARRASKRSGGKSVSI